MKKKSVFATALIIAMLAGMIGATMAEAAPKPPFANPNIEMIKPHMMGCPLTVTNPTGGEFMKNGKTYSTQFKVCSCVDFVSIHLYGTPGTPSYSLGTLVPAGTSQSFQFTIPAEAKPCKDARLAFFCHSKNGTWNVIYSPYFWVGAVEPAK